MSQFPMDFNTLYGMYQQRRMMNQPSPLATAYNDQFNRANYNNEVRYGDIITGLTGRYDRNMDRINSLGAQEREDIGRRADQQLAGQRSDLVSRGLGATTVRQSIENKNMEDRNRALRQQADNEVRQRIAADSSLSGDVFNMMERRNDVAPDLNQLAQLSQGLGASGMYGQYPGMSGGGSVYNRQPPAMAPYGGISGGNGGWGAGARQPVGRPGNRLPGYDNSQGRSIGSMNMPTTMPGTGGPPTAGGYPLPGGGSTTPTQLPGNMPGFGGDNGNFMQPGMQLPNNGMISKYRDGDRVGSAMESQLLSQLRNVGQPRPGGYRPSAGYGSQQPQGGGMIRTAGDIQNSPFDANGRLNSVPRNPGYVGSAPATGYRPATTTLPGEFQGFYGGMPSVPQFDMAPQSYNYSGPGSYGTYPQYNMQTRQFLNATRDVKPVRQAAPKRRPAGPLGPTRFFMR